MWRGSLARRAAAALVAIAVAAAIATAVATSWLHGSLAGALVGILVAVVLALWLARGLTRPWSRVVNAVRDGIVSLRDRDLSISVGPAPNDELGELVAAYNSLGDLLRRERLDLYQRELLLDTVIQTTPLAMVLTNASGRVVYGNIAARQFFRDGHKLEGFSFAELLGASPAALREAIAGGGDTLFTIDIAGEPQVYHLSQREFLLNTQPHRLVLLKQLTRELAAQEVAVWKRVTRVIAHELNNSLAPISSLAHSGQTLAAAAGEHDPERLQRVFTTIAERASHLTSFIEGYARFAKLPRPRPIPVGWKTLLGRIEGTVPFHIEGPLPEQPVSVDANQMEQVLINLLKNAVESGSPPEEIRLSVRDLAASREHGNIPEHSAGHEPAGGRGQADSFVIEIADRGCGFSDEVLRDALLPFFSTKPTGTGLGLTLCREIVEAHGGRLSLAKREGGGALITIGLPRGDALQS